VADEEYVTPGGRRIDAAALSWRFSRSSGPGGQHVNTTETQVELRCDLAVAGLPDGVRQRIEAQLGPEVRVVASTERSQLRNRAEAWRRLAEQLDAAARPVRARRATRPSRGAREERLDEKKKTGERKAARRWKPDD
jgi:ribosome-associated protein